LFFGRVMIVVVYGHCFDATGRTYTDSPPDSPVFYLTATGIKGMGRQAQAADANSPYMKKPP